MPPLDGSRARIQRAQGQIEALRSVFQDFFGRNPYRVGLAEFDRNSAHHCLRVQGDVPPFSQEWGVIIGEIAHDLRSSLDGLAWQLALSRTAHPNDRTAFPIP
jgi:hypothetical protein